MRAWVVAAFLIAAGIPMTARAEWTGVAGVTGPYFWLINTATGQVYFCSATQCTEVPRK